MSAVEEEEGEEEDEEGDGEEVEDEEEEEDLFSVLASAFPSVFCSDSGLAPSAVEEGVVDEVEECCSGAGTPDDVDVDVLGASVSAATGPGEGEGEGAGEEARAGFLPIRTKLEVFFTGAEGDACDAVDVDVAGDVDVDVVVAVEVVVAVLIDDGDAGSAVLEESADADAACCPPEEPKSTWYVMVTG